MKDRNHTFECCPICYVDYEIKEKIKILDCNHSFHVNCIKIWLKKNAICPICKASAKPKND